ncbi:MAG: DNA repair protein RecN [Prevotellaceae bacterium]|jgi:DNA repair protein RecN (Recombination protein N)|nr:DNA repair protein RecN [Prevotellaceae bacterium]
MLQSLSIKNYAIIDKLDINFQPGFSVITGETGAGKSIIMGALALILGQRADAKQIREGADKCLIEAQFQVSEYNLEAFFNANDLDYDPLCIIRRELLANGKSRAFVNDTPVSTSLLKELGVQLIDIHSQHENLLLKDNSFQLKVLDIVAKNATELKQYQQLYQEFKKLSAELQLMCETSEKNKADKDYFQFQFDQLNSAQLQENEQDELEIELKKLSHAEEIKTNFDSILQQIGNGNHNIISGLKESLSAFRKITKFMPDIEEFEERLNSCLIEIKDIENEIETRQNDIVFDPQRFDIVTQRLDLINSLLQKHRSADIAELLNLQTELSEKLTNIDLSDEAIIRLEKEIKTIENQVNEAVQKLTQSRIKAAQIVEKELAEKLSLLGMSKVSFKVEINQIDKMTTTGCNRVDFLFSANANTVLQAVSETASGGEISRVMLALKSLIANNKALPSIIFDEIDTGISGEIADKMADIMLRMSAGMQVICITHLPQIAAKGTQHYKVYKNPTTNIKCLSEPERITEIAQMLSGATLSEAAIHNAKVLLKHKK